jgi:hypothetical protein
VYSPPRREKTRLWETSFRSLFTGQPSYLPEISDPQTLDSCRVETQNRLREHEDLSLRGIRRGGFLTSSKEVKRSHFDHRSKQVPGHCEHFWKRNLLSLKVVYYQFLDLKKTLKLRIWVVRKRPYFSRWWSTEEVSHRGSSEHFVMPTEGQTNLVAVRIRCVSFLHTLPHMYLRSSSPLDT